MTFVAQHEEQIKHAVDAGSLLTVGATLVGWLPSIAAVVSIIWGLIRIYETRTVQTLIGNRQPRRRTDPPDA